MRIAEFPVTTNQLHGCRVRRSAPLGLQSRQSRQSMLTTLDVLDICTLTYINQKCTPCMCSSMSCRALTGSHRWIWINVVEYFSPIYWMVPQMVKALPPRSRRRDKPKSAKRRWPRTEHFLYVWFFLLMQLMSISYHGINKKMFIVPIIIWSPLSECN